MKPVKSAMNLNQLTSSAKTRALSTGIIQNESIAMNDKLLKPFYDYLEKERQALLTKLDSIERIIGITPRTAEIRRKYRSIVISNDDTIAGIVKK